MKASRLVAQSLRAMARYKMRSGFMMLGSFVGVASLVGVVSVGRSVERKILTTVDQLFSASSVFVVSGGNMFASGSRGDGGRLTLDDIEAVVAEVPGVEAWDPMQFQNEAQARRGEASATVRVVGQSERAERVWVRNVVRGEFFDAADVAHAARVALIGPTVARALFGGEDPLGGEIAIGGSPFRVVGLLEAMGTDAHGLDRDNEIAVPITTVMRRLLNVDTIRAAKILVHDPAVVPVLAREAKRILEERHAIQAGQPDDFNIVTPMDVQRLVAKSQRIIFVFLPLVAEVAMLVGAVVAASLMLLSVGERTSEIGLRRAVGARPRDISLQFLSEATVTTLFGGMAGILLGALIAFLVASRLGLPSFFSWKAALSSLGLAALTGLCAGVLPARRAAALPPAVALR
jgi:putative ABC transport system permease protein